ncbi:hypothetical protein QBC34DRAFT_407849 [Podospora aff. communis PSN243]|uniref:Essential protein Yae1 N-terminal domain-containing protein n=1 Tax=Podospora aff. communis PSN243 TaxID=3040156 RepID=A0AAV9GHM9_9PEZI|nr:hypothetical protein QBC34DRAFT_407849 [Podospora aff. communis PSN243]
MANEDPFEDILNLEEQFYQEGYQQGEEDGARAGLVEGRGLGLEKGFQKFFESGKLYGRAIVWANRLPTTAKPSQQQEKRAKSTDEAGTSSSQTTSDEISPQPERLPDLPRNARLEKHITTLYALVESESLSTENTDEAVNDFDDRLKRAQGKAKIIEGLVGERHHAKEGGKGPESPAPSKVKLDM